MSELKIKGVSNEIIQELNEIKWFEKCGLDTGRQGVLRNKNIQDVIKTISSIKWENIVLDFEGDITSELCKRQINGLGNEYSEWNNLVKDFKINYLPSLEKNWNSILENKGLNIKCVLDDIKSNVLLIAVLYTYRDIIEVPKFFQEMLDIYKDGHLPCGWKGKKEKGCIIIF